MTKKSRVNSKDKTKKEEQKENNIRDQEDKKSQTEEVKQEKFSLYLFLEIERNATSDDIVNFLLRKKKQYKKLVLKYHPDKNPSPEAKQQFQKLKEAYDILSDPEKRKVYDETGTLEEEDHFDEKSFQSAYEYFRAMFKKVTEEDINDFAKNYRFGKMEEEDLLNFYNEHEGDMLQLIESIPLSQNDDIPRFIEFFEKRIKEGEIEKFAKFNKTKGKIRLLKDETEEFEELKKEEQKMGLTELALAIKGKKNQHFDFLAALEEKYGGEGKKKKVEKKVEKGCQKPKKMKE